MEQKILVPVDESPTAEKTIRHIIEHRERFPEKIYLLYVANQEPLAYRMIPDFQLDMVREHAQKFGRQLLDKVAEKLLKAGYKPETMFKDGNPRVVITNEANHGNYGLVVIGRHEGGGEIKDVLFGSVANYVLHNVKCPVLLF